MPHGESKIMRLLQSECARHTTSRRASRLPFGGWTGMATALALILGMTVTVPTLAQWQRDLSQVEIPVAAATGQIEGASFRVDEAVLEKGTLFLRQAGDDGWQREVSIALFINEDEELEKRTFKVDFGDRFGVPTIHLASAARGDLSGGGEEFLGRYSMLLQFASMKDDLLTGRIYLSLPDNDRSWVSGYFKTEIAEVEKGDLSVVQIVDGDAEELAAQADDGDAAVEDRMQDVMENSEGKSDEEIERELEEALAEASESAPLPMWAAIALGVLGLVQLVGFIWFIVKGFQTSVLWAILCFVPIIGLVAFFVLLAKNPSELWKPVALQIVCVLLYVALVGYLISSGVMSVPDPATLSLPG